MIRRFIYFLLHSFIVISCVTKEEMSEAELKSYIADEKNGLRQKLTKNGISIEAFYKPSQLVWKDDIMSAVAEKKSKLENDCDTLTYFSMYISRNGKEVENNYVSNPAVFNDVINYLSFEIYNDLYLVTARDTIKAFDAVYTRTFGAGTGTGVMITFDHNIKKEKDGIVKLIFDDQVFDTGLNEFPFNTKDIKNAPTLIIN